MKKRHNSKLLVSPQYDLAHAMNFMAWEGNSGYVYLDGIWFNPDHITKFAPVGPDQTRVYTSDGTNQIVDVAEDNVRLRIARVRSERLRRYHGIDPFNEDDFWDVGTDVVHAEPTMNKIKGYNA